MRSLLIKEIENMEIQARKEWGYFVDVNEKLSFIYDDGKLYQKYVPSKKMNEIQIEAKKREETAKNKLEVSKAKLNKLEKDGKDKEVKELLEKSTKEFEEDKKNIIERIKEQQKENEHEFYYTILVWDKEQVQPLKWIIDIIIEETKPTYDLVE